MWQSFQNVAPSEANEANWKQTKLFMNSARYKLTFSSLLRSGCEKREKAESNLRRSCCVFFSWADGHGVRASCFLHNTPVGPCEFYKTRHFEAKLRTESPSLSLSPSLHDQTVVLHQNGSLNTINGDHKNKGYSATVLQNAQHIYYYKVWSAGVLNNERIILAGLITIVLLIIHLMLPQELC